MIRMIRVEVWARTTIPEQFVTVAVYVGRDWRERVAEFPGQLTFEDARQRVQARYDAGAAA